MFQITQADHEFVAAFEEGRLPPAHFDHRAHVRLAYCYLVLEPATAPERMRAALLAFLDRNDIDPAKFHATMTTAWTLAVRHFMDRSPRAASADEFIEANARLLDKSIMMTHYSSALLFSPNARASFVPPDLAPIPGAS
jgi:hypothetical protein